MCHEKSKEDILDGPKPIVVIRIDSSAKKILSREVSIPTPTRIELGQSVVGHVLFFTEQPMLRPCEPLTDE